MAMGTHNDQPEIDAREVSKRARALARTIRSTCTIAGVRTQATGEFGTFYSDIEAYGQLLASTLDLLKKLLPRPDGKFEPHVNPLSFPLHFWAVEDRPVRLGLVRLWEALCECPIQHLGGYAIDFAARKWSGERLPEFSLAEVERIESAIGELEQALTDLIPEDNLAAKDTSMVVPANNSSLPDSFYLLFPGESNATGNENADELANRVRELRNSIEHFLLQITVVTIPQGEDRRIPDVEGAKLLSIANQRLHEALVAVIHYPRVARQSGVKIIPLILQQPPKAAISLQKTDSEESNTQKAVILRLLGVTGYPRDRWNKMQATNAGAEHCRWLPGDVIRADDVALVKSVLGLLDRSVSISVPAPSVEPTATEKEVADSSSRVLVIEPGRILLNGHLLHTEASSSRAFAILGILAKRDSKGRFVPIGGEGLAVAASCTRVQVTSVIRDVRIKVNRMQEQKLLSFRGNDFILSGGPGYRFCAELSVHFTMQAGQTSQDEPDDQVHSESEPVNEPQNEPDSGSTDTQSGTFKPKATPKSRQEWFIAQLRNGNNVRASDIQREWGVSESTAKRDIDALGDARLIRYTGSSKTGSYELTTDAEKR